MTYEVIIRNQAQLEIAEIMQWYEDREKGLGSYFLICLDASIEAMRRYPTAQRIIRHEYRRFFVRKFPVGIYYMVRENKIYVDVVEPFQRDPSILDEKLKE
mgnify:CR=1 FL=1